MWKNRLASFLGSAPFQFLCRLALGVIFVLAALAKIRDPAAFADSIAAYRLLPAFLVHPAALVLPWAELFAGLFLAAGLLRRGALWLITLMLLFFLAATGFNAIRGLRIACGCFGSSGKPEPPLLVMLRDLLFLLPALLIFAFGRSRRGPTGA